MMPEVEPKQKKILVSKETYALFQSCIERTCYPEITERLSDDKVLNFICRNYLGEK